MNHEDETTLQREYFKLSDEELQNIHGLDTVSRGWYDLLVVLTSKNDFKAKMAKARHVLSPLDDLKGKLLQARTLRSGLEYMGQEMANAFNLEDVYSTSKRAYDCIPDLTYDKIKMLEISNPEYCMKHSIGRYAV